MLSTLNNDVRAVAKWALIPALLSALLTFFIRDVKSHASKTNFKKAPLGKELNRTIWILVAIQISNIPDALLLLRLHQRRHRLHRRARLQNQVHLQPLLQAQLHVLQVHNLLRQPQQLHLRRADLLHQFHAPGTVVRHVVLVVHLAVEGPLTAI